MSISAQFINLFQQLQLPSPVTQIKSALLEQKHIELFIKRDELIHPIIQGNKCRKLKYNLINAQQQNQHTLLSFGGAYSNHLHALAKAAQIANFKTIGIVRGEATFPLNPCLQDCQDWGMQLEFISRAEYRDKHTPEFILKLRRRYGDFYHIPEGANNAAGRQGCAEILDELESHYDVISCEVGSGAMLSALIENNLDLDTQYLGFAVLKNRQLNQDIKQQLKSIKAADTKWSINHDYHFGGFARSMPELIQFIKDFKREHGILLEPVYSAKMLYGIFNLIKQNHFEKHTRICAIHGGGLQGIRGYPELYSNMQSIRQYQF